jgi:ribose transport system substrate-binding protein
MVVAGCQAGSEAGGRAEPQPMLRTPRVAQGIITSPLPLPSSAPNPYAATGATPGSGEGLRIGYLSLAEWNPFVHLVSTGILDQARVAGVELHFCDGNYDDRTVLACAREFTAAGVQGVLSFQANQAISPAVCTAYGDVPTIAIDIVQHPCQVAFMGADNRAAGRMGGEALGRFVRDRWGCAYTTYVSLGSPFAVAASRQRMEAYREGFRAYCPILDPHTLTADDAEWAFDAVSDLLASVEGDRIVIAAINENAILGAMRAATAAGRQDDVWFSGQGADPTIWRDIACDPHYVASVAYFPERYGRTLIPAIIDIVRGRSDAEGAVATRVPPMLYTDHQVLTASTIRETYPATPEC